MLVSLARPVLDGVCATMGLMVASERMVSSDTRHFKSTFKFYEKQKQSEYWIRSGSQKEAK